MNPLSCLIDNTDLVLLHEHQRIVKTASMPAGEILVSCRVRTFGLICRWQHESADGLWTVWLQYDSESDYPAKMIGICFTEAQIYEDILKKHLPSHMPVTVYVIRQYAPRP